MNKVKNESILEGFSMVLFDGKFLFTFLPLEKSTGITLERTYHRKEIETILVKNEMFCYYVPKKFILHLIMKLTHIINHFISIKFFVTFLS